MGPCPFPMAWGPFPWFETLIELLSHCEAPSRSPSAGFPVLKYPAHIKPRPLPLPAGPGFDYLGPLPGFHLASSPLGCALSLSGLSLMIALVVLIVSPKLVLVVFIVSDAPWWCTLIHSNPLGFLTTLFILLTHYKILKNVAMVIFEEFSKQLEHGASSYVSKMLKTIALDMRLKINLKRKSILPLENHWMCCDGHLKNLKKKNNWD